MSNTTNRHQELKAILDRLKLVGMAKHFADLALRAAKEGLSHEAYLHELARQEGRGSPAGTTHRTALACFGLAVRENLSHVRSQVALPYAAAPNRATQTRSVLGASGQCCSHWEAGRREKSRSRRTWV